MSLKSMVKRFAGHALMICLGVLIGVQIVGTASAAVAPSGAGASAQASDAQAIPAHPNAQWHTCTPDKVATYTSRIHVKCTVPDNGIWYFAVPTSDSKYAARALALLLTAQATGGQVLVLYDLADTSGTAYGCLETDCRPMLGVEFD